MSKIYIILHLKATTVWGVENLVASMPRKKKCCCEMESRVMAIIWSKLKLWHGSCKTISSQHHFSNEMMKLFFPPSGVDMFWSSPLAVLLTHTYKLLPILVLSLLRYSQHVSQTAAESALKDFFSECQASIYTIYTQGSQWASESWNSLFLCLQESFMLIQKNDILWGVRFYFTSIHKGFEVGEPSTRMDCRIWKERTWFSV